MRAPVLLVANLETRRIVSLRPSAPIVRELRFGMNSGAMSTPTVAPEGASRSRQQCRSGKHAGPVAGVVARDLLCVRDKHPELERR
jgi:hypothetical protein